jgi:hypothetical protein
VQLLLGFPPPLTAGARKHPNNAATRTTRGAPSQFELYPRSIHRTLAVSRTGAVSGTSAVSTTRPGAACFLLPCAVDGFWGDARDQGCLLLPCVDGGCGRRDQVALLFLWTLGAWATRPPRYIFPASMAKGLLQARFLFSCVDGGSGNETRFLFYCVDERRLGPH